MEAFNTHETARLSYASFVIEDARLLYLETPKVACSSFKHSMAALAGVDATPTFKTRMAAKSRAMGIHDRTLLDIPSLVGLTPEKMQRVLHSHSYLRFCVVRDPFVRLASAWTDRILCHSISPLAPLIQALGFPKYEPDRLYLRAMFTEFVNYLYHHEAPHFTNHHWDSMASLLLFERIPFDLVIHLENIATGVNRLLVHVERAGLTWPGLPRLNETPVQMGRELFTAVTMRRVAEMYETDFTQFKYPRSFETASAPPGNLPNPALVKAIQERNQRIFFLSLKTRGII